MIRLDEVRARIEVRVPELVGRLGHAGDFAKVVEKHQLPQITPAGFVLPGGISGGKAEAMAGAFIQSFVERVLVAVVIRTAGDPLESKAIDEAAPIVRAVILAVAGWGPEDAPGIFRAGAGGAGWGDPGRAGVPDRLRT